MAPVFDFLRAMNILLLLQKQAVEKNLFGNKPMMPNAGLRGAWRDHYFPVPFFPDFRRIQKAGLEDLKITSISSFSLKCQRKEHRHLGAGIKP